MTTALRVFTYDVSYCLLGGFPILTDADKGEEHDGRITHYVRTMLNLLPALEGCEG